MVVKRRVASESRRPGVTAEKAFRDRVMDALRSVMDPELGVNLVDLGLIYGIEAAGDRVSVRMTLTNPACPINSYMTDQARAAVLRVPGVKSADVELVWEPPWEPSRMSPAAKRQLRWT